MIEKKYEPWGVGFLSLLLPHTHTLLRRTGSTPSSEDVSDGNGNARPGGWAL